MTNHIVSEKEVASIIDGMPNGMVASFTYQGNPTRLLLNEMTEDAQLHALRILAKCREIDLSDHS